MTRPPVVPFFIAHQGCPHCCVFCNQQTISGGAETLPSPEEIVNKVTSYAGAAGNATVEAAFFGGTFTSLSRDDQGRLLQSLQPFVRDGRVCRIRVSTRPDAVTRAGVRFLQEHGVDTVELGVQSLDDEVLRRSNRGHTSEHVVAACRILKSAGLRVGIQLMAGLPGDTPATATETMERALHLRPDFLRIYPTLVLAGTDLERLFLEGSYVPLSLGEAVKICKGMLLRARRHGIPVIRIGIQPTDDLETPGTIVAGPYHPAFRQLVENALWYDLLFSLTDGMGGEIVTVRCPPPRISDVTGQHRANITRLLRERAVNVDSVKADPHLAPFELVVESRTGFRRGTITGSPLEVF